MDTGIIRDHYDVLTSYYVSLWDQHIHHGYFVDGDESRAEATDKLIRLLLDQIELHQGARVLDIGCGIGATSALLAREYQCNVLGISLSPEQVDFARRSVAEMDQPPVFEVQDANDLRVDGDFDLIWSVEMISHLDHRAEFFRRASRALVNGGFWCIAAWSKRSNLDGVSDAKFIRPIEAGMLVNLPTKEEYFAHFTANDLQLIYFKDISAQVASTWDISLGLLKEPQLWKLATHHGREFVDFLKAFRAMQAGFRSGAFRYIVMVAQKHR